MEICSAAEIRAWDAYTLANEPIASIDLMERAARKCYEWILAGPVKGRTFSIYCGKGNNGGDGLALARMLHVAGHVVHVLILEYGHSGSVDFQANLSRLHETDVSVSFIASPEAIHSIPQGHIIIDALFGTGLNRPLDALASELIIHLNGSGLPIISIDMPSGLFADASIRGQVAVKATHTLSFQCFKLAFLLPENEQYAGQVHIMDIELHPDYPRIHRFAYRFIDKAAIAQFYRTRSDFTHKGMQGHAALFIGQAGMMGAAILAARACLRCGAGKVTCYIPAEAVSVMQVALPEAICRPIDLPDIALNEQLDLYDAWGAGPGIGTTEQSFQKLAALLRSHPPRLVLDADAINLLSGHTELLELLPAYCVLTPHIGEWERLVGKAENDFHRVEQVKAFVKQYRCMVILKGRYTLIAHPESGCYFNTSGNSGLAKAGTGDVLTGMITSYMAQGYDPWQASLLGVYTHGLAADMAIRQIAKQALLASDVVDHLTVIRDTDFRD